MLILFIHCHHHQKPGGGEERRKHSRAGMQWALWAPGPGSKFHLHPWLSTGPWAHFLTSLCRRLSKCKVKMTTVLWRLKEPVQAQHLEGWQALSNTQRRITSVLLCSCSTNMSLAEWLPINRKISVFNDFNLKAILIVWRNHLHLSW